MLSLRLQGVGEPRPAEGVWKGASVNEKRDEELLSEHLAGEAGAFDVLVTRYLDGLYAFFQRFVGKSGVADDLVQETFLQVHLAAHSFDPDRSFKPWLYTIAANKARDYMRSRGRRPMQSLDVQSDTESPTLAAQLAGDAAAVGARADSSEQQELVRGMMAQMPEHLRLILILGYYQKLPYSEIAEILGIPVGTVKSRLHSAVTHFARLWRAHASAAAPE